MATQELRPPLRSLLNQAGALDKWSFYQDEKHEWRWSRKAPNGDIVGASSEGYKKIKDCIANAERNGYIEIDN